MFCPKCGSQLNGKPKFCNECGAKITISVDSESTKQTLEHNQCPGCGATLKSFETTCSACGREIRNTDSISSVKRLERMLSEIEEKRQPNPPKGFWDSDIINPTDSQKASCIEAFVIPNTKEDIIEFMILAASNIDSNMLARNGVGLDQGVYLVTKAWYSKFEQAYQKSKFALSNDSSFTNIEQIYSQKQEELRKEKWKWESTPLQILAIAFSPLILGLIVWIIYSLLK